jgi:ArsR family transcriptional regulator, lead/cadmium/zinc/bismuth-responsive transcriptional repressor
MHLLPAERAGHRIIDPEKVCDAIESLGDPAEVTAWARRFALLADPTRLRLLLAIKAAGPVSVSDLAAAAGISDVTVSQTLRHLRASGTVTTERDGRIIRYRLRDEVIGQLLNQATSPREQAPGRALRPTS